MNIFGQNYYLRIVTLVLLFLRCVASIEVSLSLVIVFGEVLEINVGVVCCLHWFVPQAGHCNNGKVKVCPLTAWAIMQMTTNLATEKT